MLHLDLITLPVLVLIAEIVAYTVAFSILCWLKYESYGMYAWDLGVYNQSFYTTVHSGRFFFSTVEWPYTQFVIPAGSQFAVHFSPIFFLLLPFYALVPSPVTLLVLKTIGLAFGAVPVYLLSLRHLSNPWVSVGFAGAYLLLPALQGVNWYDFQPHAFFATAFLFSIYFLETGNRAWCIVSLVIGLSTIEVAPIWGIALGLFGLYSDRARVEAYLARREWRNLAQTLPAVILVISVAWLVLVFALSATLGWQGAFHPSTNRRFAGTENGSVFAAVVDDWPGKLVYVALLFGPLAFAAFLDVPKATLALLWVIAAVVSDFPPFHQLSLQYAVFALPFVAYASIGGIARISARLGPKSLGRLGPVLLVSLFVSVAVGSPFGPLHFGSYPGAAPFGVPTPTAHDALLTRLLGLIPDEASILTQNHVFPHVSNRLNAFVLPFSATFSRPGEFNRTLDAYFQQSAYVIVDSTYDPISTTLMYERTGARGNFGVFAEADGILLFRQNFSGPLALYDPFVAQFDHRSLRLTSGAEVLDGTSQSGVVLYVNSTGGKGDFWDGPGLFLARGNYSVTFRIRIGAQASGSVLTLGVVEYPALFSYRMLGSDTIGYIPDVRLVALPPTLLQSVLIQGNDFATIGAYQDFTLRFGVSRPGGFAFTGNNTAVGVPLYLDTIRLVQESP